MSAKPTPVLPAVASRIVDPACSTPRASASRIIPRAARSLILPPGFRNSNLANTAAAPSGVTRASCSMGVWPTSWVMSEAILGDEREETATVIESSLSHRQVGPAVGPSLLLPRPRGLLRHASRRIIPRAGADFELTHSLRLGRHLHTPKSRLRRWLRRVVANCVLVANITRHFGGNFVDLLHRLREERHSAGFAGKHLQGSSRMAHLRVRHLVAK